MSSKNERFNENQKILRLADLEAMLGLSKVTIWRLRRSGDFPQPIKISARSLGWRAGVIQDWLDSRG